MDSDLTDAERALLAEHAKREHEERLTDPEFRKGWERMQSLFDAEAERDSLRARLTGVAIHANRLKTRIAPGTDTWTVLADLLNALDHSTDTTRETETR